MKLRALAVLLLCACGGAGVDGVNPGPPPDDPGPTAESCTTPGDEDGNGLPDCEDPSCAVHVACTGDGPADSGGGARSEVCDNVSDDDGDGSRDCDDVDCWSAPACNADLGGGEDDPFDDPVPGSEVWCDDYVDDDGDGLTDCSDSDCTAFCELWYGDGSGGDGGDAGDEPQDDREPDWGEPEGEVDCGDNAEGDCFCDVLCVTCGDCCPNCEAYEDGGFGDCGCDTTLYCDWDGAWDCACDPDC